jgi:hypothetical protein
VPEHDGGDRSAQERARARRRRTQPPADELGGAVLVPPATFRSADRAVQLSAVRVFSSGIEFEFQLVLREERRGPDALHAALDIPERRTVVPGSALTDGAGRLVVL